MSIYLSFFLYKEACSITSPSSACLLKLVFLPTTVRYRAFFEHGFSVLDIKPLMKAANLTVGCDDMASFWTSFNSSKD